jgi:hypothetical protein
MRLQLGPDLDDIEGRDDEPEARVVTAWMGQPVLAFWAALVWPPELTLERPVGNFPASMMALSKIRTGLPFRPSPLQSLPEVLSPTDNVPVSHYALQPLRGCGTV